MGLIRSIWLTTEEAERGLARLAWPQSIKRRPGLTIADLPEPEPVHPKRLLAELAEEFDKARPPLSLLLADQPQVFKMATYRTS